MPLKTLIDLYFDNKVQILPAGKISFFNYLHELELLLTTPGLINIDEADLKTVVFGAKEITIIAINESGEDKARQICRKLTEFADAKTTCNASGTFFHIIGDPNTTLYDVNAITESIFPLLNEKANIIFGSTIDEKLDNTIKLLLVLVKS